MTERPSDQDSSAEPRCQQRGYDNNPRIWGLTHIRAATGTPVQRTNCHPFQHRIWLFVHNSAIRSCQTIKRDLVLAISPESSFVTVSRGDVHIEPFEPDAP